MRYKNLFCSFFIMLILTSCATPLSQTEPTTEDSSYITLGNILEIKNLDTRLVLLDHKETLATDGLYYLSWGITNSEIKSQETDDQKADKPETDKPEVNRQEMNHQKTNQNNDEDVLPQYPAQLYLLAGEAKNKEEAQQNLNLWLSASKENYQILAEKEISCNEQTYSVLFYNRSKIDHTYTKGISVFATIDHIAICIELICTESFPEDLETTITNFLNNCSYLTD